MSVLEHGRGRIRTIIEFKEKLDDPASIHGTKRLGSVSITSASWLFQCYGFRK